MILVHLYLESTCVCANRTDRAEPAAYSPDVRRRPTQASAKRRSGALKRCACEQPRRTRSSRTEVIG
ncbi:hypothetical protein MATL_G00227480 [Megalops atlanticus]|uniref:Uncharacterized protein n=1 Tax=Megalops atlanticus TaxID=7932 RepID=A0A9D3PFG7_MEGAT|nr:hypothetical protein MATL_G00227480 [Megalops atlanticus]